MNHHIFPPSPPPKFLQVRKTPQLPPQCNPSLCIASLCFRSSTVVVRYGLWMFLEGSLSTWGGVGGGLQLLCLIRFCLTSCSATHDLGSRQVQMWVLVFVWGGWEWGGLQQLCFIRFCLMDIPGFAGCDLGSGRGSNVGVWGRVLQPLAEPVLSLP